jgi:hypothetical protein
LRTDAQSSSVFRASKRPRPAEIVWLKSRNPPEEMLWTLHLPDPLNEVTLVELATDGNTLTILCTSKTDGPADAIKQRAWCLLLT